MPELPEVQTTVNGLRQTIEGLKITDVWTDYNSPYFKDSETIKDPAYFRHFKREVVGEKVVSVERRAKNILINISHGKTIIVHMKMTGHLLFGKYRFDNKAKNDPWEPIEPEGLKDPFNRRVHFMITFNNNKNLALSDMRKFAKVAVVDTELAHRSIHLHGIGPEPLEWTFTFDIFLARIYLRPRAKVKQVLLDQTVIAGIGNIYADESLWRAGVHPASIVEKIPREKLRGLFTAIKNTLAKGIEFGGDSMSDYRNVHGEKGRFQEKHNVYKRKGERCRKAKCSGIVERTVIAGRGTHFCKRHQKLY